MKNFGTLYRFELRKIFRRKMVWIAAALVLAMDAVGVSAFLLGSYYVDGEVYETHYESFLIDSAYQKALTGRLLDETLIDEMQEGYGRLPEDEPRYNLTEEYEQYARPYSAIFSWVRNSTGWNIERMLEWARSGEKMGADTLRELRHMHLEEIWKEDRLAEAEKNFWRKQEAAQEWPMKYSYVECWDRLLEDAYSTNFLILFLMAVCLTGVFAEEHVRRTDQLILSTRLGRKLAYLAKICAGVSFAVLMAFGISTFVILLRITLCGSTGFSAAVQLSLPTFCGEMTVGQAALILYGCILVAAVLVGVLTMLLAELLHGSVAALAVMTGILVLPAFIHIPAELRALAQIWDYMPGEIARVWGMFGNWLVPVFGCCFYSWQAVPAVYLLLTVGCALLGWRLYDRYQVKGR